MGITTSMGLLKFALLGIDLLGWPVIALGYPLFASIRAVETGSRYQMRKLVIYWTLFSLFSLFEFTLVKIIEWIPFWSGVRLVVSFLLVMPQFDGACLAYQGLVRSVIDRFGMLKEDRLFKRQMFLDVVEKYIKENGSEALEKLIALETGQGECSDSHRDVQVVESEAKNGSAASQQVQQAQSVTAAWDLNGTFSDSEDKDIMPPKETAEYRLQETSLLKKAQQEWTGDLCKVSTESESTLNDHLQGSKHKSKLEPTLEASLLDAKDTAGPSPSVRHAQSVSAAWDREGTYATAEVKEIMPQKDPHLKKARQEWKRKESTLKESLLELGKLIASKTGQGDCSDSHRDVQVVESEAKNGSAASQQVQQAQSVTAAWDLNGTFSNSEDKEIMPPKETAENRLQETSLLKKAQQEWTGDLCKVTTESESTLNDHLQGSKHKSKLEPTLEASLLDAKDTAGPSPSVRHAQSVSAAWDREGTYATAGVKEIMPPKDPHLKKARQEWKRKESTLKESLLELEKLIASKTGQGECSDSHRHVQVVESEAMNGSAASQQYTQSIEVPKRTDANAEVKETMPPETSRAETPPLKKEWSCGLCKVKAKSEKKLNAHLLGSKHKSKLESLKTWKGNLIVLEINGVFKHWCIICDAKLPSDVDLASHLKGKRHASNIEEMEKLGKK